MPRSLVLGNGEMLVGYDKYGLVRDFFYPYVGSENHTGGCQHKIGLWIDGTISWLSDAGWDTTIDYEKETMVSSIIARHKALGVEVLFTDVLYNEQNIFIRKVRVKNAIPRERAFKIFFNQQFQMAGDALGHTAYYDVDLNAVIHYRGRRTFLVSGTIDNTPFNEFGIGLFNTEGREGTWKDAEDGNLSNNPVEHGSVDSTISFAQNIKGESEAVIHYWVIASTTIAEAKGIHNYIHIKTVEHLIETTRNYWHAWVNKVELNFDGLDGKLVSLFKKSLLIMQTHVDRRGAIMASCDSDISHHGRDTYAYMWPRDAGVTAMAFDRLGYSDTAKRFYEFCNEVISEEGFLYHKYRPDKSLGSSWHPWVYEGRKQLAIQEDETALIVYALWRHYEKRKDIEFIERIYNSFIKRAGDFLYYYRDENTGLPYGSYDLWEEKYGTSTYTASVVYAGLCAAGHFAETLGKKNDTKKYKDGAIAVKHAIIKHLYNKEEMFFYKLIDYRKKEPFFDRTHDMSSFYGPFRYGVLPVDDKKNKDGFLQLQKGPCCVIHEGDIGGTIRYDGDRYHRRGQLPNPWVITTLWMYQYEIAKAKTKKELKEIEKKLDWIFKRAPQSGILAEQFDPYTGEQLSVAPLTWSHAEYVHTILDYLEKLAELEK